MLGGGHLVHQVPEPATPTPRVADPQEDGLDELCARLPDELDALYRHCVGYPGVRDRRAFAAWLRRGQVAPSFYFGAYADASLGQVLTALDLRERLRAFALATQGLDAAALQAAYRRTFGPAADTAAGGQAPPAAAPREG